MTIAGKPRRRLGSKILERMPNLAGAPDVVGIDQTILYCKRKKSAWNEDEA
jgi:hypothetical protein